MSSKIIEHILSILFVTIVLSTAIYFFETQPSRSNSKGIDLPKVINFDDQFEKQLTSDILNIFKPGMYSENQKTLADMTAQFRTNIQKGMNSFEEKRLSTPGVKSKIMFMYIKFVLVYFIVMLFTDYGVRTAAVIKFFKQRQMDMPNYELNLSKVIFFSILKFMAAMILFSPAYVIAYSIKTELNTDTVFFMIFLGTISNGVLILYTNKFFTFLETEYSKGYVSTAIVKNLNNSYEFGGENGISLREILHPIKKFNNHLFAHVYRNASIHYMSSFKEQASFLISGLVIIEMALNIHGYLNYELLRNILYGNYSIVLAIILLVFYTSKGTEILSDLMQYLTLKKFEDR